MAMMKSRRSGRSRWTIFLLVLTTVTVLTLDFRGSAAIDSARHAAGEALSPFQGAADWVATPFQNMWNGITRYDDVADRNDELAARVAELEGAVARDADAAVQLSELLDQVDIPWIGDLNTATARVVRQPASAFSHIIGIDKGTDAGIRIGMPVVTGAGLVGRVVDVTTDRSQVQLVTDPEFRVGVRLVTSQRVGTAIGQGAGRELRVDTGIEPDEADADLPALEIVTTSGIDDRSSFPAFIPVGRVTRTREVNGGLTLEVLVEPLADLDELSFVNVILAEPVR